MPTTNPFSLPLQCLRNIERPFPSHPPWRPEPSGQQPGCYCRTSAAVLLPSTTTSSPYGTSSAAAARPPLAARPEPAAPPSSQPQRSLPHSLQPRLWWRSRRAAMPPCHLPRSLGWGTPHAVDVTIFLAWLPDFIPWSSVWSELILHGVLSVPFISILLQC